jgi:hypothetical protein
VLEDLALTLILEAGQHTPVAEAAWLHALRTMDEDPEAHALTGLALAFWGQPLEWRRRLRHCDHTGCAEPYFLARTANRRGRYCTKAHAQTARRQLLDVDARVVRLEILRGEKTGVLRDSLRECRVAPERGPRG